MIRLPVPKRRKSSPKKRRARKPARRAAKPRKSVRPKKPVVPPKVININKATIPELITLPHVGPEIARRIVAYREKYGRFDEHWELMEVEGIGQQEYDDIKHLFVIE